MKKKQKVKSASKEDDSIKEQTNLHAPLTDSITFNVLSEANLRAHPRPELGTQSSSLGDFLSTLNNSEDNAQAIKTIAEETDDKDDDKEDEKAVAMRLPSTTNISSPTGDDSFRSQASFRSLASFTSCVSEPSTDNDKNKNISGVEDQLQQEVVHGATADDRHRQQLAKQKSSLGGFLNILVDAASPSQSASITTVTEGGVRELRTQNTDVTNTTEDKVSALSITEDSEAIRKAKKKEKKRAKKREKEKLPDNAKAIETIAEETDDKDDDKEDEKAVAMRLPSSTNISSPTGDDSFRSQASFRSLASFTSCVSEPSTDNDKNKNISGVAVLGVTADDRHRQQLAKQKSSLGGFLNILVDAASPSQSASITTVTEGGVRELRTQNTDVTDTTEDKVSALSITEESAGSMEDDDTEARKREKKKAKKEKKRKEKEENEEREKKELSLSMSNVHDFKVENATVLDIALISEVGNIRHRARPVVDKRGGSSLGDFLTTLEVATPVAHRSSSTKVKESLDNHSGASQLGKLRSVDLVVNTVYEEGDGVTENTHVHGKPEKDHEKTEERETGTAERTREVVHNVIQDDDTFDITKVDLSQYVDDLRQKDINMLQKKVDNLKTESQKNKEIFRNKWEGSKTKVVDSPSSHITTPPHRASAAHVIQERLVKLNELKQRIAQKIDNAKSTDPSSPQQQHLTKIQDSLTMAITVCESSADLINASSPGKEDELDDTALEKLYASTYQAIGEKKAVGLDEEANEMENYRQLRSRREQELKREEEHLRLKLKECQVTAPHVGLLRILEDKENMLDELRQDYKQKAVYALDSLDQMQQRGIYQGGSFQPQVSSAATTSASVCDPHAYSHRAPGDTFYIPTSPRSGAANYLSSTHNTASSSSSFTPPPSSSVSVDMFSPNLRPGHRRIINTSDFARGGYNYAATPSSTTTTNNNNMHPSSYSTNSNYSSGVSAGMQSQQQPQAHYPSAHSTSPRNTSGYSFNYSSPQQNQVNNHYPHQPRSFPLPLQQQQQHLQRQQPSPPKSNPFHHTMEKRHDIFR